MGLVEVGVSLCLDLLLILFFLFQVIDYSIPASHALLRICSWPDTYDQGWKVKPDVGLRAVKGSMGLRGWRATDWVKHQVVPLGEFVVDTDLPRGRYLLLPFGSADTGPDQATHWVCPCGGFKVPVVAPGNKDR